MVLEGGDGEKKFFVLFSGRLQRSGLTEFGSCLGDYFSQKDFELTVIEEIKECFI